jgi:hypothetical protein
VETETANDSYWHIVLEKVPVEPDRPTTIECDGKIVWKSGSYKGVASEQVNIPRGTEVAIKLKFRVCVT